LPPGSQHELAALAFATIARRTGLDVIYLGGDLPLESWLAAAAETDAAAAVLGAVMPGDAQSVSAVFAALAEQRPDVVRAVGGPHAGEVRGEGHMLLPHDLAEAAALLGRSLPRRRRGRGGAR
jgi:methylmalonyl-CoA mutase cobalamin-binding subunit